MQQWTPTKNYQKAQQLKIQGNQNYLQKEYIKALRAYHQALLHLGGIIDKSSPVSMYSKNVVSEEMSSLVGQLKFSIYMNMSQIYLHQHKYQKALEILKKAQEVKSTAKLCYRRAIAFMKINQIQQAKLNLNQAFEKDPTIYQQVAKLQRQIIQAQKQADKASKKMFQNFFK